MWVVELKDKHLGDSMLKMMIGEIKKPYLIGLVAPFIALICIAIAILLAPYWTWEGNALSDLGHYTRTDIGPNPMIRALIFNAGLFITSILMIYTTVNLFKEQKYEMGKLSMLFLIFSECFLAAIGIFSENFGYIHYIVSVGFFGTFPLAMWFASAEWIWNKRLRWLGAISLLLPFFSYFIWKGYYIGLFISWTGVAIPEILTAFTCIIWVWLITITKVKGMWNK